MAFALVVGVWAFRKTAGSRASQAIWRRRTAELEDRIARADSVFGAHPGLVVVWDEPPFDKPIPVGGSPRFSGLP